MYPKDLRYSKTHEWMKQEGPNARVGISDYAQEQLGDIVYVELPEVGRVVQKGEVFGVVESVKAVSDCYAPVSGKVVERNGELESFPEAINQDPYGRGWLIVIEMSDPGEVQALLDAAAYEAHVKESH